MEKQIPGAEALMRSLIEEDADTIFGYIGGAIMPVYDALLNHLDKIKHIMTRHEQGAIHAAQAFARLKRKPGICLVTSGPGATNLITGLADAMIDSTPLVCVTGQVKSSLLGMDAFQETDVVGISMPITKWNFQITKADEIPDAIARAFYIANTGRPGPVLLDITKDAQMGWVEYEHKKCNKMRTYLPYPVLSHQVVEQAADLINNAQKPLMLVGQGVCISRGQDELLELVEKTGIPVASTILGLSAFPSKHPLFKGMLGMHGNYAPNILTNECDVLLAVGMRFDDRVTGDVSRYAKQTRVIHIEIDDAEINKIVNAEVGIKADAREALAALVPLVQNKTYPEWIAKFEELAKVEFDIVIDKQINGQTGMLKMGEIVRMVSEKTGGDAIVITDVGQQQMMTARYFEFTRHNSFISSGGLGTMGFGLPAAIGAALAEPDRQIIAFIGDGGFQMTIQELQTIYDLQVPVKIVLLNNNYLGMVRQWQDLFFDKRYSFTEMSTPDFIKIAEAYKMEATLVAKREELSEAVDRMLEHQQAFLLEVKVEREDNVFPMIPAGESITNMRLE